MKPSVKQLQIAVLTGVLAGTSPLVFAGSMTANPCAAKMPSAMGGSCAAKPAMHQGVANKTMMNPCAAKNPCKAHSTMNPCAAKPMKNPCAAKMSD